MKKIKTIFILGLLLVCSLSWAQTMQVTGTVSDSQDGLPLPGAYVFIKGGTGVIADDNGNYSLSCEKDAILSVSYVGYIDQDVEVNGRSIINIALVHSNVLDEVVVTALGITRDKKSMGYAIQEVEGDVLTSSGQVNVANALSGKVAGLQVSSAGGQVGASSRFVIRGNSSLGNNEPLFVVDGVPIANDQNLTGDVDFGSGLMDINPDDIESISVLKGGAGALYGMRAGNGVILITTKSGKSNKEGISISYDGSFAVDQIYNLPAFQNKYGQGYSGSEYDYNKSGYNGSYADWVSENCFSIDGIDAGADESWGPRLDIGLMIPQFDSPLNADGTHQATPWVSHPNNVSSFFQNGYTMSHNVAALIKTEKSSTRAALGFRDQQGTLPNTDQKRYNAQINSNFDFNKYLGFNLTMNYTHTESKNLPMQEYTAGNPLQSMLEWFGRQVDMNSLKNRWQEVDANGYPFNWNPDYHQNPYYTVFKNTNSLDRNRLFGKTSLFISPTKWLKIEGRLGYDYYQSSTFQKVAYNTDYPNGAFWDENTNSSEVNADIIAMFNHTFWKDVLSVNAILGANYRNYKWKWNQTGGQDLTVPELYTISNVGAVEDDMDHAHIRSNSVYANLSLGFKGWLYLDASARNDWDSTIADSFFYPSVSMSWVPTATFDALKSLDVLNLLKIRAGWAKIGSATSAYRTGNYYSSVSPSFNGASQFLMPTQFPPAGLRPESVQTFEVGLELQMFKGRLGLDMALYTKKTTDQILPVAVSKATGYNTMLVNAGEFNNKGIEVQLTGRPIETKDWSWDLTLNWSKDVSSIESLYTDPVSGQSLGTYTIGSQWSTYLYAMAPDRDENGNITKRYSWGTLYGTGHKTDEKGNVIVDEYGFPILEKKVLGDVTPQWMASLRSELRWKDLSFGFMLDYRQGGDFFSVTTMWGQYTGVLASTAANNVREDGAVFGQNCYKNFNFINEDGSKNQTVVNPQDAFYYAYSDRQLDVADGSFLKLRELHLTYTYPSSKLPKNSIVKGFNVSFIANNVGILWLHPSNTARIDPESGYTSGNAGVGLESGSYMPSRSMGIKFGITF